MTMRAHRQDMKRTSNGDDPARARNVCTSAVVTAFTRKDHLSGRYLHTGDDVRRALRAFGYSIRSVKTLAERQVRCKSGLKVSQVERLYERGLLAGSARPGEVLVGVVWGVKGHTGCICLDRRHDTAYRPGAGVRTLYGVYAPEDSVDGLQWNARQAVSQ